MKTRVMHNADHDDLEALFIDDDGNEVWAVIACPFSPDDPLAEEYYQLVNSTGSHGEAVGQLFGEELQMIHTKEEFFRLKAEAETLWAKRDALIDRKADLQSGAIFVKELDKLIGLQSDIAELAEAARLIEEQAAAIYNDPQTWDSETSPNRLPCYDDLINGAEFTPEHRKLLQDLWNKYYGDENVQKRLEQGIVKTGTDMIAYLGKLGGKS